MGSRPVDPALRRSQFLAAAFEWALSIATVAGLAFVGWLGHSTHWTFGLGQHDDGHGHAAAEPAAQESTAARSDLIEFPSAGALQRAGIEIEPVERRPIVDRVTAHGVVRYDERHIAQLSTRVPGSIWRVEKHLGDQVSRGDVLLVVESSDVGRLKAEFLNALVAYETRRVQLTILEEVKGVVMGRQIREASAALRAARIDLFNAEQALVNLGYELSIAEYEPLDDDTRASRIRTLGVPPELLANLLPLRAPFAGVVTGREVVVGELVDEGKPIFEVADVSTMWVALAVSKEDASRVAIGQPVRFRPDGADVEFESRVTWIGTAVDDTTRTLEVRTEIPGDGPVALRANTFGMGSIEVGRVEAAVVVPSTSVQWDGARWVVFVPVGDSSFAARQVEPGLRAGGHLEIRGGFAGDAPSHVVTTGSHLLKSKILLDRMESGEL
jgi:membrane fusion protein, heavy metal efflux system